MRIKKQHFPPICLLLLTVLLTVAHAGAQQDSPKEKVLISFTAEDSVGNTPIGALISDGAGNFYGVNTVGGVGSGTVYEISPSPEGGWTAKSIDALPVNSYYNNALVMDSSGNLYGTLYSGGAKICTDGYGDYSCGAVYELSPNGSGAWTEKIIWNASQTEGWRPYHMVVGPDGNLYGTTYWAGEGESGTVFELQRNGGQWTHSTLSAYGGLPDSLVFDKAGNLYGTNYYGGEGGGTLFQLKKTNNSWEEVTLFDFNASGSGASGGYGVDGVIPGSAGNFYGTTDFGGVDSGNGYGVVFELSPTSSGAWQETVLYTFLSGGPDESGARPLLVESAGNLYGATYNGGPKGYGTVFQLKPSAKGGWSYTVLHNFQGDPADGKYPNGLLVDSKGNLYGTTSGGGAAGVGTVFEITP
jgi:uncharacterized repeat protein (TIGR03803 family)